MKRAVSRTEEKLKKLIEQTYVARLRRAQVCTERFSQEHLMTLREREVEELRAMAYLKVIEQPENKSAGEEERKNRVIGALVEEKKYRTALTSISRCQLKINRLNAEMSVLEAGIKKAESEEQLLFLEIEKA